MNTELAWTETAAAASKLHAYDAAQITVLSGVEAVRKRPAMYIGSTDSAGLNHLACELVENAVDEFLAGACSTITVELLEDGSCVVTDDGRGIPVSLHPSESRPTLELLLTRLHSGGKFSGQAYRYSGGLHGIGLTCVNALSELLMVEVWRDGRHYIQQYSHGNPASPLREEASASAHSGTRIRIKPDPLIFGTLRFSYREIFLRLRDLAFLNGGLRLILIDAAQGSRDELCYTTGLAGLVRDLNRDRGPVHPEPFFCHAEANTIAVDVALQWTASYGDEIHSFVNSVRTSSGGSHVEGMFRALVRAIGMFAAEAGLKTVDRAPLTESDVREGLGAVLSVRLPDPQFASQTKRQLVQADVAQILAELLLASFERALNESPHLGRLVAARVLQAQQARLMSQWVRTPTRQIVRDRGQSLEVYRKQFGTRARNWHDSCRWLTDPGLLKAHRDLCRVPQSAKLLDVCCGSGIVGGSFGEHVAHKVGLDITPEMRAMAGRVLDDVRAGSVYDIPLPDADFDIVVTREVIHLLPQAERALTEIHRVLRPGGQIIFGQTVPYDAIDAAWMFRIFKKKQPLFCNHFFAEEIVELLARVGYREVEFSEYLLWEPIDLWIDTHETTALHRAEIRELYYSAPDDVRAVHPFEVSSDGKIRDQWRWCIFSARIPE
jgi:DNA gyrase subunit B